MERSLDSFCLANENMELFSKEVVVFLERLNLRGVPGMFFYVCSVTGLLRDVK